MKFKDQWFRKVLIVLCVILVNPIWANKTDSLLTVLKNHQQDDALKMRQKKLAESYKLFGIAYFKAEQYREAYENYLKAIPLYQELADTSQLCFIYGNIRLIFEVFEDYDKELEYSLKIEALVRKMNNTDLKIEAYLNLAFTYRSQKNFERALKYFEKTLYLVKKKNDQGKKIAIKNYYGSTLKELNQYSAALPYLLESLNYYELKGINYFDQASCNNEIGMIYCTFGDSKKAEIYLSKSKEIAERLTFPEIIPLNYLGFSKIDSIRHDFKNALKNYQTYITLDREYHDKQQKKQMLDVRIWNESENIQKEKVLLVKEEQRQKALIQRQFMIILSLSGLLIFIIIVVLMNLRQHRKTQFMNLLLEKQKLEILDKNKDMEYLHKVKDKLFSVISHDLRSPVIGIQNMLTLMNDYNLSPDKINDFINSIREEVNDTSDLLNNLLQWSRIQMKGNLPEKTQTEISLLIDETIRQLDSIASLKQIELKSEFTLHVQLICDAEMLKIVLRNLVTNAIKFSYPNNPVIIGGYIVDNFLVISVKDSGTGILPEHQAKIFSLTENVGEKGTMLEASTSLGLILCHDFVDKSGGKIWFETEQEKGSIFFFSLPLQTETV